MAFEVVPTAAGRLHSDQYTKIIIINTPINLRVFPWFRIRIRMCISVKKIQREKFDVSQKPLIQKMHTEPEILNWGLGGSIVCSDLHLCDSPARLI